MPNHIKNKLEIIGSTEQISAVLSKFSTHFERKPNKSHDGDLIFRNNTPNKNQTGEVGWLNEATNVFTRRDKEPVSGVPEGFEQDFEEAWDRFPDFEKIIKMPESLSISSDNWLMPLENRFCQTTQFKAHLDELRSVCEKSPGRKQKIVDNFIAGIKNYIDYGHATWYNWSVDNWGTKWNCYSCEKLSENTFLFDTAWAGVPNLIELMSKEFPEVTFVYKYSSEDTGCNCGVGTFKNGESNDFRELENQSNEAYELAFELRPDRKEDYKLTDSGYQYSENEN